MQILAILSIGLDRCLSIWTFFAIPPICCPQLHIGGVIFLSHQFTDHRNHMIFSREEAQHLPTDQPYILRISYSDWTEGHEHLMHCHPDIAEVLLILRGHGRYSIGLHRYAVEAGDVILCNGGVIHDEFPQTDQPYHTLCIGIKQLSLPGLPRNHLIAEEKIPIFHKLGQIEELSVLIQMIERHAVEQTPHYQMLCQNLMLALLELIQQMIVQSPSSPPNIQNALCARVEAYIYQHYTENLTIDQLGKIFLVSPYHLAHLFKQQTGYTLKQYILRRRIGEAQTRLTFSEDSVTRIAADTGFEDAGYFTRLFTKFVGMSPTEYRDYRNKHEL